jgi:hypothetical protein
MTTRGVDPSYPRFIYEKKKGFGRRNLNGDDRRRRAVSTQCLEWTTGTLVAKRSLAEPGDAVPL